MIGGLTAVLSVPAAAEPHDTAGWAAFEAQRFDEAVALWRVAADAGDAEAQFGLGVAYDLGHGVAADPLAACRWYSRAGTAGLAAAAFNMAVMVDNGRCGPRQADVAASWYARAAASGHARARYNIAQLYAAGDGVPRNPEQAAIWFRAAAASGVTAAANRLQAAPIRRAVPAAALTPASPTVPAGVIPTDADAAASVALVWSAPAEDTPTRFLVEVYALDGPTAQPVFSSTVDESATLVTLPPAPARYAWRVVTFDSVGQHYATSEWLHFRTKPGARG